MQSFARVYAIYSQCSHWKSLIENQIVRVTTFLEAHVSSWLFNNRLHMNNGEIGGSVRHRRRTGAWNEVVFAINLVQFFGRIENELGIKIPGVEKHSWRNWYEICKHWAQVNSYLPYSTSKPHHGAAITDRAQRQMHQGNFFTSTENQFTEVAHLHGVENLCTQPCHLRKSRSSTAPGRDWKNNRSIPHVPG